MKKRFNIKTLGLTDDHSIIAADYRFLLIWVTYFSFLVLANLTGFKIISLAGIPFTVGIIFFSMTYVLSDVVNEVYGFKTSRMMIMGALIGNILIMLGLKLSVMLAPDSDWSYQKEYELIFELSGRIFIASVISYLFGELLNIYILSKLREIMHGKYMVMRFSISTMIGALVDSLIFFVVAFYGVLSMELIIKIMLIEYSFKVLYEILLMPIILLLVSNLKRWSKE